MFFWFSSSVIVFSVVNSIVDVRVAILAPSPKSSILMVVFGSFNARTVSSPMGI